MHGYGWIVAGLNFLVSFFLLLGVRCMTDKPPHFARIALGAGVGGVYGGLCMVVPSLAGTLYRLVIMALSCVIAYGRRKDAVWPGILYGLLQLALTGIAAGLDKGGIWSMLAVGTAIAVLCTVGLRDDGGRLVKVELTHGHQTVVLTALRDTGNHLRDPITGQRVLVVGAQVAEKLTGLTREQLRHPVEVMGAAPLPGLRLIPYRTIDSPGGMLLALRVKQAKIGSWTGSTLVAFAPEGLGQEEPFQALTGGAA